MEKALERLADRPRLERAVRRELARYRLRLGRRLLKMGRTEEATGVLARTKGLTPLSGLKAGWIVLTTRPREVAR